MKTTHAAVLDMRLCPFKRLMLGRPIMSQRALYLLVVYTQKYLQKHLRLRQVSSAGVSKINITFSSVPSPVPGLATPGFLLSTIYRTAILGLTKSLSKELDPDGIRVNSITTQPHILRLTVYLFLTLLYNANLLKNADADADADLTRFYNLY